MNYIVLNDREFYRDINLDRFKEVSVDGEQRVDAIFGTITKEVLEQEPGKHGERDLFSRAEWPCRNSGVRFMVIKVPQDILYDDSGESLERCFGLFDKEGFWLEMGAVRVKGQSRYEYFFVAYNKNALDFKIIFNDGYVIREENEVLPYILEKIKKVL